MRSFFVLWALVFLLNMDAAEILKMRTIAQGNFSGVQPPTQMVVSNAVQWQEVWINHSAQQTPVEPAPQIDFEKESILFVAAGRKRSGGHHVEIAELKATEGRTVVLVKLRGPKAGGIQLQAVTAPFHIVAVPKLTGPVEFRFEEGSAP